VGIPPQTRGRRPHSLVTELSRAAVGRGPQTPNGVHVTEKRIWPPAETKAGRERDSYAGRPFATFMRLASIWRVNHQHEGDKYDGLDHDWPVSGSFRFSKSVGG